MKQKVVNQFRVTIETRVKKLKLKLKFKVCPTFVHIGTEILKNKNKNFVDPSIIIQER